MTDAAHVTDFLTDKRKYVLWLQWLLVVAISYLLYFNVTTTPPNPLASLSLILLNAGLNAGLFFLPHRYFQPVIWNATTDILQNTDNINVFTLAPVPFEVQ